MAYSPSTLLNGEAATWDGRHSQDVTIVFIWMKSNRVGTDRAAEPLPEKQHQSQLQIGFERTYQPREQTQRIVCVDGNDHEEKNIGSEEEGYEDKNDEQQETAGDDGAMEKGQEEKLQVRRHWPRRRKSFATLFLRKGEERHLAVDVPARRGCEAKVLGGGFSQCAVLLDGVAAAKFAVQNGRNSLDAAASGSISKDPAAPARLITHPPSLAFLLRHFGDHDTSVRVHQGRT
ncbi:hypothetical protein BHE74_00024235 [Ensete ventricosum]|nr:hypothetical protein BHE74_00024235 [Ensete ventricosum]